MKPSAPVFCRRPNGAICAFCIYRMGLPRFLPPGQRRLNPRQEIEALSPSRDSEFSEALRILGEFENIERAVARVRLSLPYCSIGHFILDLRHLPRWPASCDMNQRSLTRPFRRRSREMNLDRFLKCRSWPFRNSRRTIMKHVIIPLLLAAGFIALTTMEANAVVCA